MSTIRSISWMIDALTGGRSVYVPVKRNKGRGEPEYTLARTGCRIERISAKAKEQRGSKCTLSVNPQQRTRTLPLLERVAFCEPQGGAFVASIACRVIIYRWIWGREPVVYVLSQLIPCEGVSLHGRRLRLLDNERFWSSI